MSKPSLSAFMLKAPEAEPVKATKSGPPGEDLVALSFRMPRSTWQAVVALTTSERTKIQRYLLNLVKEDFARRGLHLK